MNALRLHPWCRLCKVGIATVVMLLLTLLVSGRALTQPAPPPALYIPQSTTGLLTGIQAISVGYFHACALTTEGGVKCWGRNTSGQLGDGTTTGSSTPVDVSGLSSGVQMVATGRYHTCALTIGGGVKCWGNNGYGQLGDGTTDIRYTPVDVSGLSSGVQAITADRYHTCALTIGGGVKCWGSNGDGQLGDGTTTSRSTPVDVSGLSSGVQMAAAGSWHTCALTAGGGIKCWGDNEYGQLGDGTNSDRLTPVDVSGLTSGVQMVAAGYYHTCAPTTDGGVKCWGHNWSGQLGDGTTTSRSTPVDVSGLSSGVRAVATGRDHTCALTTAGSVQCWGYNGGGLLGDGTDANSWAPVDVSGLGSGIQMVATAFGHTCALTTGGGVKCWGSNSYGQLGGGTDTNRWTPVDVSGLTSGVQMVAVGYEHTCALTTGGGVKCWGDNGSGQLGDGTLTSRYMPGDVSGLSSGVQMIAVGDAHTCALTTSGGVKCWGYNGGGQLGDGTAIDRSTPVDVSGLSSGVQAVETGMEHTCALTTSGGVKCWGRNGSGQLGDGTIGYRLTPVEVYGLASGVGAVAAGWEHTCALTIGGGVKCWGDNGSGQLGDGGTAANRFTPVDVSGLTSGVQAITAGGWHTCALTTGGGVKCWGSGRLGNGTDTPSPTPVDVSGLSSGVQAVVAGYQHTCALTTAGGAKCWGDNYSGQLGDGTGTDRSTPVDVSGLSSGVQMVAAGEGHTCALTTAGGAKCWGGNYSGQLGVNPGWTPVDVVDGSPLLTDVAELAGRTQDATVAPGAPLTLWINVRNSGTSTWSAGDGYGWRGTGQWQGQTGTITGTIAPGQEWPFTATVVAPQQPGSYVYGLVLQHNGVDFSPTFSVTVTVISSAVLPDFQVDEGGYSFANGGAYTSTLAAQTVYGIFGDSACWQGSGPQCTIRHETALWANRQALNSTGGQCNGMSITSLRFYQNLDQPGSFQPSAAKTHDLSYQTPAVPQHIVGYQVRWDIPEVQRRIASSWAMATSQVLAAVEQGFAAGGEPQVLYISDATGAHALAPYRVERLGEDDARIYVYDSNYPDSTTRYVTVRPQSGTWQYEFVPGEIWSGRLTAYPAAAFAGPLPWEQPAVTGSAGGWASVLVSASPGLVLRGANGEALDRLLVPSGGPGPSPSLYILPQADRYDLVVDRSGVAGGQGSLMYIGQAGLAAVEGLVAAPVSDTLTLNSAAGGLVYAPGTAAALTVTLSADNSQKDVLITAGNVQLGAQAVLTAAVTTGQMAVALGGADPATYSLGMFLHSPVGVNQQFLATDVTIQPGVTQLADIPVEIGASLPITTVVADTGQTTTGTLDNELVDGQNLFLPAIVR